MRSRSQFDHHRRRWLGHWCREKPGGKGKPPPPPPPPPLPHDQEVPDCFPPPKSPCLPVTVTEIQNIACMFEWEDVEMEMRKKLSYVVIDWSPDDAWGDTVCSNPFLRPFTCKASGKLIHRSWTLENKTWSPASSTLKSLADKGEFDICLSMLNTLIHCVCRRWRPRRRWRRCCLFLMPRGEGEQAGSNGKPSPSWCSWHVGSPQGCDLWLPSKLLFPHCWPARRTHCIDPLNG